MTPPDNPNAPRAAAPLRLLLRSVFAVGAAIWMVAEEWLWDGLVRATKWLARLPPIRWVEARIQRLGPKAAMAMFVVPWLLLLPAKLLGLWLLGSGRYGLGIAVFVVAKLVGTALLARLFTLTRPALLQVVWFRRFHGWFTGLRDRLYAYVRSLHAYQATRRLLAALRQRLLAFWHGLRRS